MSYRKIKQDALRIIGNYSLVTSVNILCRTLRIKYTNKEIIDNLERENKNYILAFWHGTMLLPWYLNRGKKFAALISKSKDGNLLAKILKNWNYIVIRGSSSMGGEIALGIMIDYAKNNSSVAITPDGPRGPARKMKAGAVVTSKKAGKPLVLMGIGYKNKKVLDSWDKFEIPKLFSRVNVLFSEPVFVERNLTYEETSSLIESCERKMNELQNKAEEF